MGPDLPLWALLLLLAAAAAAIYALLSWLYSRVQQAVSGSGPVPAPAPAPPPPYVVTLEQARTLLDTLRDEQRPPTADECRRLRDALAQARTEGVPDALVEPMQAAIDQLCD